MPRMRVQAKDPLGSQGYRPLSQLGLLQTPLLPRQGLCEGSFFPLPCLEKAHGIDVNVREIPPTHPLAPHPIPQNQTRKSETTKEILPSLDFSEGPFTSNKNTDSYVA